MTIHITDKNTIRLNAKNKISTIRLIPRRIRERISKVENEFNIEPKAVGSHRWAPAYSERQANRRVKMVIQRNPINFFRISQPIQSFLNPSRAGIYFFVEQSWSYSLFPQLCPGLAVMRKPIRAVRELISTKTQNDKYPPAI